MNGTEKCIRKTENDRIAVENDTFMNLIVIRTQHASEKVLIWCHKKDTGIVLRFL
jgi:hypothetical protein